MGLLNTAHTDLNTYVNIKVMMIDLTKEMAWITFADGNWGTKWFPVTDIKGNQLPFDDTIMDYCRAQYNGRDGRDWTYFGIAPTSQMILGNSVRDNL